MSRPVYFVVLFGKVGVFMSDTCALNTMIQKLILAIYEYNKRLQFRDPSDIQCIYWRGRAESLMDLLESLGYPVTHGTGSIWSSGRSRYAEGYGYMTFSKNQKEFEELGIHAKHGFENGIYWFVDGRGVPTMYRGVDV